MKHVTTSTTITLNVRTLRLVWTVRTVGSACEVVSVTSLSFSLLRFKGVPELLSVSKVLLDPMLLVVLLLKTYLGGVLALVFLYSLLSFLLVLEVADSFEEVCAGALLLIGTRCFQT
jgi:hypothetical protein